jgi:multiple sugar transport system substrate-binding protein
MLDSMADNFPPSSQVYVSQEIPPMTPPPPAGPAMPAAQSTVAPPPPKKQFPKIFVFLGLGIFVLILAVLLFKFVFTRQTGGKEIVWWGLWEEESVISPLIAEYEQENPGVKITYLKQSQQDYRERLTNSLAKGSGPDIFSFHNTWVPMFANELDQIPADVYSADQFAQTFFPTASSDLTSGAGLVGIPLEYDGLALYINEDIFNSAGKTPPVTWDDLRQLALQLTQKDEQGVIIQAGVALGRTENVDHWPEILSLMMLQNGVNLSRPTGKLAEDALTFYTLFSSVDGVWDASLPSSTVAFAAGKVAMYFGPSWRVFEIIQQNPNLKFKTVPVPQLPKEAGQVEINYASYWAQGVWARSKSKTEAWKFLKFISSRESLEKIYQNAAKIRAFGQPYPRTDMTDLLKDQPVLGSIIAGAPTAQTWYLQSRTWDGPTGINSLMDKYFEDAINAVNSGTMAAKALETVSAGVSQVLGQYGLITR